MSKLYEVKQVEQIHHALILIRNYCSRASDEALRASVKRLRRDDHRTDLLKWWVNHHFDRLPHSLDVGGDPTLIVLASAAMMRDAGRRYRNCLETKISEAFLGTSLFIEYRPLDGGPGAIAELHRTNQGFLLQGLFAADNRRLRPDRADLIRRKLMTCGVAVLGHAPDDREAVRATARMLDQWVLGDPDNHNWGDEPLDAVAELRQALDEAA